MKDLQSELDSRNIPIDKVGIKNLRYPVAIKDRSGGFQKTIASINMYVDLLRENRGTHMSRFVQMLHIFSSEISMKKISFVLKDMKNNLGSASAHIDIGFPYFIEKRAPVSSSVGFMDYNCRFVGSINSDGFVDLVSEVTVPISSVCPCSKEISDFGAHNQRGEAKFQARFKKLIWLEDMIELVESCASCEIYSVLKRIDEKQVTEFGFTNSKFVEDIVRDIAKCVSSDDNITWFSVSVENFESIHNHNAYAYIES